MERKDFLNLRLKIHEDFKKWFSYSLKHNCLYADWLLSPEEERALISYVSPDCSVMVVPPCSIFIFALKK